MLKNIAIISLSAIGFVIVTMLIKNYVMLNTKKSNTNTTEQPSTNILKKEVPKDASIATFAGGCFWCMEPAFEATEGVYDVIVGYSGGDLENPTYEQVVSGKTGHLETAQVYYNADVVSFSELLDVYWRQIDPTDAGGQFADRGDSYRSAIFYHNEEQKADAEASLQNINESGWFDAPVATQILPYKNFYKAEEYHQDYYLKASERYKRYEKGSGRADFKESVWGEIDAEDSTDEDDIETGVRINDVSNDGSGASDSEPNNYGNYVKPSDSELREMLTDLQYRVTQKNATERAFNNEYWDNKSEGIYVDIVSGEPLFSSTHKYKSGTGWPSFYDVLEPNNIVEKTDRILWYARTEIKSKHANSHLGHVFNDGPEPTGLRYCMNSAALRFVSKDNLEDEGYGEYSYLFE